MVRISSIHQTTVPPHVVTRELDGEAILLNLDSEFYFGFATVDTCFRTALCKSLSIEKAYYQLLEIYKVEVDKLRQDLKWLIDTLVQHGLVHIHHYTEQSS